ncbi:MutS protein msh4 [Aspergillus nanangensis]|uniref:MutS protein msh4 n=1 Tax=Aspergillus nanangensis TaxID=2582783 RepID=A0AAD4GPM6_ASPNN|nr:MutS protein msh4 [Aspergillus nanangensis]
MANRRLRAPSINTTTSFHLSRQSSGPARTRPTTTATSVTSQDIICAVSESRGVSSTVGITFINLSTAETVLCQICDTQTYVKSVTKIAVFEPTEILFMNTAKDSKLSLVIQENIEDATYTFLDRKFWSERTGHEYVDRLAFPEDVESIKITLGGNYFAACCFAAALKYAELELNRAFTSHSLRIRFEPSQGSMSIDLSTTVSLELVQNLQNPKSKESLFGLLNETLTPMGPRLLKANILQPSTEAPKLLARYDAVEDLSTKEEMFSLKGFVDADRVLSSAGVNSLLDVARQTYKEANMDAAELVSKLSETHDIALDLKYDTARQYYMCLSAAEVESLPEVFINVYRKKHRIECQTLDLVKLNQKIIDAHNEVINMSDQTVQELIHDVCTQISHLFRVSEAIAMLDLLASYAHLTTAHDYIRPELTDTLALKSSRHPIREKIHTKKFVPNDAYATSQSRFQIITGCNMSGKSTYIRTVALTTIMAQIGCFVPAEYASFPIMHQLFARVSTADDLKANVSTFAAEMREMAFILRNIEPQKRSMVIIDELGRGTSTTDGLAIAVAIAEALIESQALVWFVTHFHDLAVILGGRPGVMSLHLTAEISNETSKMTMLYKITEGPDTTRFYGLALAKVVDLPVDVFETAQAVSEKMNEIIERRHSNSRAVAVSRKRNLILSLREQLLQARNGSIAGEALRKWLKRLQDEFTLRMAAIDDEEVGFDSSNYDEYSSDCDEGTSSVSRVASMCAAEEITLEEPHNSTEDASADDAESLCPTVTSVTGERSMIEILSDGSFEIDG